MIKNKRGITLIALVITIIILLILAGISISTLAGSGLFEKAKLAGDRSEYAAAKEQILIKQMEVQAKCIRENKSYTIAELANNIQTDEKMTIEKMYYSDTETQTLEAIVISVNEYSKYKFLIGKNCNIKGITTQEITDTFEQEQFEDIEDYEKNINVAGNQQKDEDKNNEQENIQYTYLEDFDDFYKIRSSTVQVDTNNKKEGNASAYFENNTYIECNIDQSALEGDFTVEYWYYEKEQFTTGYEPHLDFGNGYISWGIYNGNFGIIKQGVAFITTSIPQMNAGEWVHVAITREESTLYVFFNGVLQDSYTCSGTLSSSTFTIGKDMATNYLDNAYIDELRIIKGQCLWNSNFNVDEQISVENEYSIHFDSEEELEVKTEDNYTGNATISEEYKKFGTGSLYLNNTYCKINVDEEIHLEGDFTIDYWYYQTEEKTGNAYHIVSDQVNGIWIGIYNGNFTIRTRGDTNNFVQIISTAQPDINTWNHVAVTRKDNIVYLFINGEQKGSYEYGTKFDNSNIYVGYDLYSATSATYIDELRIVKGYCQWTENFEVSTNAYEKITE